MIPTFVIGLREGVEAALIVGIVAAFLRSEGRRDALRWVWAGVALATVVCLAVGLGLDVLSSELPYHEQEGLETVIALVAVAAVSWMIVWMRRNARRLRGNLEQGVGAALAQGSVAALVAMAFFAVFREGFESSVFLLAAFNASENRGAAAGGALLGFAVAAALGWGIYRGGIRIDLARFFRVTGAVLVFVAAGLTASAAHSAHEAGWVTSFQTQALDLTWLVEPGSVRSALLTGMLGLQPRPTVLEVASYLVFLVPMLLYVLWPRSVNLRPLRLRRPSVAETVKVTAVLAVPALVITALVAGCGSDSGPAAAPATSGASSSGHKVVNASITDAGCDPAKITVAAGPTTFVVRNDGADQVTEFEVLDGKRILGEAENLAPGLEGKFSLTLEPGTYATYCPGGDSAEYGVLDVTGSGAAVASETATRAVATYRAYVVKQTTELVRQTAAFAAAVKAGDVAKAKSLYSVARLPYERIEPVAESFGDLDAKIDAREGDVPFDDWTGFHPIEKALYQTGNLDGTPRLADLLVRDVKRLHSRIPRVKLEPAQIANGAVELLGEVSKSKITGEEERYSHIDLVDMEGNVDGARSAFEAVKPIVAANDRALAKTIDARFAAMDTALDRHRAGGPSGFVSYTALTDQQTRELSRAVDALAEPLSRVGAIVVADA